MVHQMALLLGCTVTIPYIKELYSGSILRPKSCCVFKFVKKGIVYEGQLPNLFDNWADRRFNLLLLKLLYDYK